MSIIRWINYHRRKFPIATILALALFAITLGLQQCERNDAYDKGIDNIERAIDSERYQYAIDECNTVEKIPNLTNKHYWYVKSQKGYCYYQLIIVGDNNNKKYLIHGAKDSYTQALSKLNSSDSQGYSVTLYNLGCVYYELSDIEDRMTNLSHACDYFTKNYAIDTPENKVLRNKSFIFINYIEKILQEEVDINNLKIDIVR
ncbi:hypothetical protein ACFLVB_03225 [Chloroflexota bacterium]